MRPLITMLWNGVRWFRVALTFGLLWMLAATGCGSSSGTPAGGSAGTGSPGSADATGSAGSEGGAGQGGMPPHRAQALACSPTSADQFPTIDGGTRAMSCTTDADCVQDGGYNPFRYCFQGLCRVDQCLVDGDCSTGQACGCSTQSGGTAAYLFHTNLCVPATCRVDADCGASGLCSPAIGDYCTSLVGYHCRSAADTCRTDADCHSVMDGGITVLSSCRYAPDVHHWQCLPFSYCS